MKQDNIETLIEKAHQLLSGHSIYEAIDLKEEEARDRIRELFGEVDQPTVDAYLEVFAKIRREYED